MAYGLEVDGLNVLCIGATYIISCQNTVYELESADEN